MVRHTPAPLRLSPRRGVLHLQDLFAAAAVAGFVMAIAVWGNELAPDRTGKPSVIFLAGDAR